MNIQAIVKEEILGEDIRNIGPLPCELDVDYLFKREGKEELVKGFSFHLSENPNEMTEKEKYDEVKTVIEDVLSQLSVPFSKCHTLIADLKLIEEYGDMDRWGYLYDFIEENCSKDLVYMTTCSTHPTLEKGATNRILFYVKY